MLFCPVGLINEKSEEIVREEKYNYWRWVQNKVEFPISETDCLELRLVKQVFDLNFKEAEATLLEIVVKYNSTQKGLHNSENEFKNLNNIQEVYSLEVAISTLKEVETTIKENEELKELFLERTIFNIEEFQN